MARPEHRTDHWRLERHRPGAGLRVRERRREGGARGPARRRARGDAPGGPSAGWLRHLHSARRDGSGRGDRRRAARRSRARWARHGDRERRLRRHAARVAPAVRRHRADAPHQRRRRDGHAARGRPHHDGALVRPPGRHLEPRRPAGSPGVGSVLRHEGRPLRVPRVAPHRPASSRHPGHRRAAGLRRYGRRAERQAPDAVPLAGRQGRARDRAASGAGSANRRVPLAAAPPDAIRPAPARGGLRAPRTERPRASPGQSM